MIHLHDRPVAITFTGGIDSTVLAYWVCSQKPTSKVHLVACNYGQANWQVTHDLMIYHFRELTARFGVDISWFCLPVPLPDWSRTTGLATSGFIPPRADAVVDYDQPVRAYDYAYIDGRNALLFTYLFSYCSHLEIPALLSGHQYETLEWARLDSYRHRTEDFSPMFLDRMNLLQEVGFRNRVRLHAPFMDMRLPKKAIVKLGLDLGVDLERTYSCQFYPECGKCDNCLNKTSVLKELGICLKGTE
jgi:7-cyano-7-deazaguanine synthase in queuosine biosynthesis